MERTTLIRPAAVADLETVVPLFVQYLDFYRVHREAEEALAFLRQNLTEERALILVAEVDGEALGFAQVYPTRSSLSLGASWVLNDLFVDPQARGTGAGRALLREVCRRAAEAGVVSVSLETAEDNGRAQGLYESEGFRVEEGFRHYGRTID